MVATILRRCGEAHPRSGFFIASTWGLLVSNHAESLPTSGRRHWRVNRGAAPPVTPAGSLHLDFPAFTNSLPLSSGLEQLMQGIPENSGEGGMPPEEQHLLLWQHLSSHPAQCQDRRLSKQNPRHPDFGHNNSRRLDSHHKPAWLDSELAKMDAAITRPLDCVSSSVEAKGRLAAHEGHLEVDMCRKLCEVGRITDAVDVLNRLVQRGCHVSNNLFYRAIKACVTYKELALGRRIHALTVESGYEGDAFLATHLIGLYSWHGKLDEAMRVFAKVSAPDAYNWATIIFAYARHGEAAQAIQLYRQMRDATTVRSNNHIYVAVLKACAAARDLVAGKEVHAQVLACPGKIDVFVQTGLVNMYANCGSLEDARSVFDKLPQRDVVMWTAMIAGYVQQGMAQEALTLYNSMQQEGLTPPDSVTFVCLLQACACVGVGALHHGKQLHAQTDELGIQDDVLVGGSLVNMYAKCGSLEDARSVFDRLPNRNVVACNAMLSGYARQGMGPEALGLYTSMQLDGIISPDSVTFVSLLQACASVGVGALRQGKQLHAQTEKRGLQDDVVVGGSLVNMYAKCGTIEEARIVFDRLPYRHVVTWNAMLAGYAEQAMGQEAFTLYTSMQHQGVTPNSVTFVCLLQACALVAALPLGKQLHAEIVERGLQADAGLGAALVNMYAKCGSMFDSQQVFDSLPERTMESWNALTGGYTRQGDSEAVFGLLHRMRLDGKQPNDITFLSVLSVCSHVGLVDEGQKYFDTMWTDHGVSPTVEHYTCMIDLLGRAGHLDEALRMAKTMPFPTTPVVWLTVLGACRKWKNVEIAQQAFKFAVTFDGKDSAFYVLMSNIYAGADMWEEAKEMQARRVKSRAWKNPGQSWWTDMGGVVHAFVVGDKKHPESQGIYARLEQRIPSMQKEGTCAAS